MKSVAYIRVSTTDQHLENQKIYLNREAERSDDSISHFYEDHGISGVKSSRPSLNQLFDDARKNKFEDCMFTIFLDFQDQLNIY